MKAIKLSNTIINIDQITHIQMAEDGARVHFAGHPESLLLPQPQGDALVASLLHASQIHVEQKKAGSVR